MSSGIQNIPPTPNGYEEPLDPSEEKKEARLPTDSKVNRLKSNLRSSAPLSQNTHNPQYDHFSLTVKCIISLVGAATVAAVVFGLRNVLPTSSKEPFHWKECIWLGEIFCCNLALSAVQLELYQKTALKAKTVVLESKKNNLARESKKSKVALKKTPIMLAKKGLTFVISVIALAAFFAAIRNAASGDVSLINDKNFSTTSPIWATALGLSNVLLAWKLIQLHEMRPPHKKTKSKKPLADAPSSFSEKMPSKKQPT